VIRVVPLTTCFVLFAASASAHITDGGEYTACSEGLVLYFETPCMCGEAVVSYEDTACDCQSQSDICRKLGGEVEEQEDGDGGVSDGGGDDGGADAGEPKDAGDTPAADGGSGFAPPVDSGPSPTDAGGGGSAPPLQDSGPAATDGGEANDPPAGDAGAERPAPTDGGEIGRGDAGGGGQQADAGSDDDGNAVPACACVVASTQRATSIFLISLVFLLALRRPRRSV
jgi:hypothetical protein